MILDALPWQDIDLWKYLADTVVRQGDGNTNTIDSKELVG